MNTPNNTLKHALEAGQRQYGFWLGLCNAMSAELCANTGYDWLLIDGEHAPNDLRTTLAQLQAIQGTPTHPVVRVVDSNPATIKQYLDIGTQSLLVPMVETAEQAHALVEAVHYPPNGIRGVGTALARAAAWNMIDGYFQDVDNELCLIVQIESLRGLHNLDEILAVEGIDAVFIGPSDLAATMGFLGNPTHTEVQTAIERATDKIRAAGKPVGTLATTRTAARRYEAMGMQFIALGVDTLVLARGARDILVEYRAAD
jgi:4-hydroxy-2-oxoheptanedioate aldolase